MRQLISRIIAKIEMRGSVSRLVARYLEAASENRLKFLKNKYNLDNIQLTIIERADPTNNGEYLEWIINQVNKRNLRLPEDVAVINPALNLFHNLKNKRVFKDDNNIRNYKRPGDLYETLEKYKEKSEETSDMTKRFEDAGHGYAEMVHGPGYVWYKVATPEAARALGSGTSWCTVQTDFSERYLEDGPLYILYKNNKPKVQIHFESDSFMDEYDNSILIEIGDELYVKTFREEVCSLVKFLGKKLDIRTEPSDGVLKDPENSYFYAMHLVKGRFPEGESTIATDATWSYNYADDVLKGRFPEGEASISKNPKIACAYAQAIIKGRWPEGEPAIAETSEYSLRYARFIIKGRWPEGEPAISTAPGTSYSYAMYVIDGRFPEGESAIATSPAYSYSYAFDLLKDRFPEGEDAISKDLKFSLLYAIDVIGGRFPKAEPDLLKSNYRGRYLDFLEEERIPLP